MCNRQLVGNRGKCGATLPESLPPHFKESTGGIRQCRRLCCGLWLAQAWEEWCEEALTLGCGLAHRLAHTCLAEARRCWSAGEQREFAGLVSSSAGSLVTL